MKVENIFLITAMICGLIMASFAGDSLNWLRFLSLYFFCAFVLLAYWILKKYYGITQTNEAQQING
jgi:Ca2+/Na+ antiporter